MAKYHMTIRVRTEDSRFNTILLEERLVSISTPKKAVEVADWLAKAAGLAKQLLWNGLKAIKKRNSDASHQM